MKQILSIKKEMIGKVKVKRRKKEIKAVTGEPVSVLTKKGEKMDDITKETTWMNSLKAPIKKGDEVGRLHYQKRWKSS